MLLSTELSAVVEVVVAPDAAADVGAANPAVVTARPATRATETSRANGGCARKRRVMRREPPCGSRVPAPRARARPVWACPALGVVGNRNAALGVVPHWGAAARRRARFSVSELVTRSGPRP